MSPEIAIAVIAAVPPTLADLLELSRTDVVFHLWRFYWSPSA